MKRLTRRIQLDFLRPYQTTNEVLDIGAGTVVHPPYRKLFPNRVCVDIDESKKPDIVADITSLPFDDESYDFVLCIEVLDHLKEPRKAADELYRILRKGGTLIMTTRFIYPVHSVPHDYLRYTPFMLEEIFKQWKIEELKFESEAFTAIGILLQRIGFQTELRGGKLTKAAVYFLAWVFTKLDWLVKAQYGEIERAHKTEGVFTTGIYMILRK
jgi:SAM-dependent methyltransferase